MNFTHKAFLIIVFINLSVPSLYSQSDSLDSSKDDDFRRRTHNVVGFIPSKAHVTNGWAIGWAIIDGYDMIDGYDLDRDSVRINGLYTNISPLPVFGFAMSLPYILNIFNPKTYKNLFSKDVSHNADSSKYVNSIPDSILGKHKMNGVSIGTLEIGDGFAFQGLQITALAHSADKLNGVSLTTLGSGYKQFKGVMISGLLNWTDSGTGLQLGLINRMDTGVGLQVGLINTSKKMRGVQIGLWNKIGNRGFPIINMRFK